MNNLKDEKIILRYVWYRKFENPKISNLLEKTLVLSIICSNCKDEDEKIFKEKKSIEILKSFGLINNIEKYKNI